MTKWTSPLHQDTDGVKTAWNWGDPGSGVNEWWGWIKNAHIGDKTDTVVDDHTLTGTLIARTGGLLKGIGAQSDTAATDHTTSESLISLLKGLLRLHRIADEGIAKAEDAAHFSGDAGVMALAVRHDTPGTGLGANGDYAVLSVDSTGDLRASSSRVGALSNARTTALATNLVAKASAGTLFGLTGYSTTTQFLQIHDASSLPADTAVPAEVIPVTANAPFSIDFGPNGVAFTTGIVICNSSTGPTKTIGSADTWVSAQYE